MSELLLNRGMLLPLELTVNFLKAWGCPFHFHSYLDVRRAAQLLALAEATLFCKVIYSTTRGRRSTAHLRVPQRCRLKGHSCSYPTHQRYQMSPCAADRSQSAQFRGHHARYHSNRWLLLVTGTCGRVWRSHVQGRSSVWVTDETPLRTGACVQCHIIKLIGAPLLFSTP